MTNAELAQKLRRNCDGCEVDTEDCILECPYVAEAANRLEKIQLEIDAGLDIRRVARNLGVIYGMSYAMPDKDASREMREIVTFIAQKLRELEASFGNEKTEGL